MLVHGLLFVIFWLLSAVYALHASEAGVVDWHKPFIGVPFTHSQSLAPTFHRFNAGTGRRSTKSVVLSATSSNVLAALDAVAGNITWRYGFDHGDPIVNFRAFGNFVVSLSGPGGSTFRAFDTTTGDLLAERRLHAPEAGHLFEPVDVGVHLVFADANATKPDSSSDVFALTNGYTVRRIDAATGRVKWEWASGDRASAVVYSRIARTSSTAFVVGLAKSTASYSLHVTALSADTGEELATVHIPSNIRNGLTDFLVLSDDTDDNPYIVWLEDGQSQIRFASLAPALKGQPKALKGATFKSILNIGLNEHGHFVALETDGTGMALKLDRNSQGISLVYEFDESSSSDRYTESIYSGGLDKDNKVYIGRVFWSHVLRTASAHVFAPHAASGKGMVRGYTLPFDSNSHGIIAHAAMDAAQPSDNMIIGRFVLVTSTGAVQLWQHDRAQWTREEALSEVELAEFIELPERKTIATHVGDGEESFVGRVTRQVQDAKDFPSYLLAFVRRFATGSYTTATTSAKVSSNSTELERDEFGFRKLIVAATRRGVVYGIDSASGAIVWSRLLGLGWAAKVGGHHVPLRLFATRTVNDGDSPRVVLITQRIADNELVDTVAFHIDALTGEDAEGKSSSEDILQGVDIISGESIDVFMLRGDDKIVVLLDKFLQVYLFPDNDETRKAFQTIAPKLYFPLLAPGRVLGHQVSSEPSFTGKFTAYSIWTTLFSPGETVVATFRRPPAEPIASFGKVLSDRSTLYKYLIPHLVGYVTRSQGGDGVPPTCGVYLVDGAKGSILYRSTIPSAHGACDVKVAFTENWLLYIYYDEEIVSSAQSKGYRVVSVEFYEGKGVNDKTKSSETSIYSNRTAEGMYYEQTFIFPYGVTALTTTSTKFGIATKDLVVANNKGQIQTFPRRIFDPRRPKRKVTAQDQEEWLVQYDPIIPDDSRRVISHNYHILSTKKISTSPSLLESTSLVLAHGGPDLFLSRVAPSHTFDVLSEEFNKLQLVLTIAGLSVAILVTRPIVRGKKLKEAWY
ncbi:DUF1620-domain-containing protein [Fomitiporia mediterranea MF3/22]|uniref:DUF1620-domain-containing protein n=1 Tax=Fomitiporia mediterranea (strain MF3/22) TaxID=694068 RepID=UPI0004408F6D|nr:DUF1620-domain-containing protein [Fomitiporia mediterranea MF3/22]EJD05202.1 DUF1620-domain-containing protein [Fomitiporia mediterranea MF3/22]